MLRTTITLGTLSIQVEAETVQALIQEVAYIQALDAARGDERADPFHRNAGGFEYFGFRRADGAEVCFGQHKQPAGEGRRLFAYRKSSPGFRGWERYDHVLGKPVRLIEPARLDAMKQYVKSAGQKVPDDVQATIEGRARLIRKFLLSEWTRIRTEPIVMAELVAAIEAVTGVAFAPAERAKLAVAA
jgi:hypothetical protein